MTKPSNALNKIPAITATFWVMKILATTLGETGGDWLSMTMELGYLFSSGIFLGLFFVALFAQLQIQFYTAWRYWLVIIATSTAGTTISDFMDRSLGLGYLAGSCILICLLIAMFAFWYGSEGILNVSEIKTRKAEIFYWCTVLISNTLGTALGDYLSDNSGLGFFGSWLFISAILIFILMAHFLSRVSQVVLFWLAFILSRPFGATFGDLLTKSTQDGGFNLGRGGTSLLLLCLLIAVGLNHQRQLVNS